MRAANEPISYVVALILAAVGCGASPPQSDFGEAVGDVTQSEGPQLIDRFDSELGLDREWVGDLDGMAERGVVRALVDYSLGQYFLDGATQRGIAYEALGEFESFLNARLGRRTIKVGVLVIPVQRDELIPALERGLGDLVKTATAFFTAADGANPDLRIPALPAETRYVARAFSLDAAGGFLWPRYVEARAAVEPAPESTRALALFSGAETAEFRSKNLGDAARLYREAASGPRRQATRAAATNGLARVLAKSGRTEQAVSHYDLLLERYAACETRMACPSPAMPSTN